METGQRMVQRQQHGGRDLVVQHLEAVGARSGLIPFFIAISFIALVIFLAPIQAQAQETALSQEQINSLVQGICPNGGQSIERYDFPVPNSVRCYDSNGNPMAGGVAGNLSTSHSSLLQSLGLTPSNIPSGTRLQAAQAATGNEDVVAAWIGGQLQDVLDSIITFLASALIGLIAMLLTFAGTLFDLLITHAIINFGGTIKTLGMDQAIGLVWSVSRDVANIVIIGMFVFVAIATILGIQNYSWRQYIARILIVAIFINFSLFLTQFVIDGSNFFAYKIYEATPLLNTASNNTSVIAVGGQATSTSQGIAATFMDKIGLSGAWQYDNLEDIGVANGALAILGYALGASLLMGLVAAVLFYGVFLIVTRAILLIFLLLTSALAVGTALLPQNLRKKGWNLWLSSLINVAVFAPLIMLFLFLVLAVLSAGVDGSLSEYLKNPAGSVEDGSELWQVIITFIIAVGLLFVSFRLAGTFAKKIGGFSGAATLPALAASLGAGTAGLLGRQTFGKWALNDKARLQRIADDEKRATGTVSDKTMSAIKRRDWLSGQSFDARQLKPVQSLIKQSALSKVAGATPFISKEAAKTLAEGRSTGYEKDREAAVKKESDRITEKAKAATAGAKQRQAAEEDRLKDSQKESLQKQWQRESADERVNVINNELAEARGTGKSGEVVKFESQHRYAEADLEKAKGRLKEVDQQLEEALRAGRAGQAVALESQQRYAQKDFDKSQARMNEVGAQLTEARAANRTDAVIKLENNLKKAQAKAANAEREHSEVQESVKTIEQGIGKIKRRTNTAKTAEQIARKDRPSDFFSQTRRGAYDIDPEEIAQEISSKNKKESRQKRIKDGFEALGEDIGEKPKPAETPKPAEGSTPPPPSTPS